MKKKMLIRKRILIYAMAAALVLGEVGLTLTPVMATEAAQENVETADAETVQDDTASEEVTADAEVTQEDVGEQTTASEEKSVDTGEVVVNDLAATAGTVTGFFLDAENEDGAESTVSTPTLRWNVMDGADGYQFMVKDSKGNIYGSYRRITSGTYESRYYSRSSGTSSSLEVRSMTGLPGYSYPQGQTPVSYVDANGDYIYSFQPGEVYTICMRAYVTDDATGENVYGAWTSSVTYSIAAPGQLTNLKYVRASDTNYYLGYDAVINNSTVYYQYSKKSDFSDVKRWTSTSNAIILSKSSLDASTLYYVRAVNYPKSATQGIHSLSAAEIAALSPAVTSFTTEAQEMPKNMTGLTVYSETNSTYVLRFGEILDTDDSYEVQISKAATFASLENNISAEKSSSGINISKSNMTTDVPYYVRVVAYKTINGNVVYGTPSNVVTLLVTRKTSEIGTISLAEQNEGDTAYVFSYGGSVDLGQQVQYQFSDSKNFDTNGTAHTKKHTMSANVNKQFSIYYSTLKPNKTYYVRARVYNSKASGDNMYSAWSNTVKISTKVPEIQLGTEAITKNSIQLYVSVKSGSPYVTGCEIYRKNGKKWVLVTQTTDKSYKNTKLKENTTYTYKARAYYFNPKTKKTSYGAWDYTEAITWGGALKLKAAVAGKTSVKLTWSKIAGAKGYEIYRKAGDSYSTEVSGGTGNGFSQYKLVKTVSSGAKSYTDKNLTAGITYSYIVVAYKTVEGKKVTIEDDASATLEFKMSDLTAVTKSNGKTTVSWSKVVGAKKYLIEKKNNATGKWSKYKTTSKTSITLPKTSDAEGTVYRVKAYNGKKYTSGKEVTVYPVLGTPTKVTAKAQKDGSVKISWKKVSGADYYRIYRTTNSAYTYNKDRKGYSASASELSMYVADASELSGYRKLYASDWDERAVTSYVDRRISYVKDGVETEVYSGPQTGVTYYYYVVACKKNSKYYYGYEDGYANYSESYNVKSYKSKPAKVTVKETAPKKVTLSKAKAAKKKITLTFKKVDGVDGYEIYRSKSKKNGYVSIGTAKADATTYVDKYSKKNKITKGKTYYYKVKAFVYDDAGNKVYSKSYSAIKSAKAK